MRKVIILIMIFVVLVGCNDREIDKYQNDNEFFEERVRIDGYGLFVKSLEEKGYDSIYDGIPRDSVLSGESKYFILNDEERITIYEYYDAKTFKRDIYSISEDGFTVEIGNEDGSVTTSDYSWISTPNFYIKNNLIVQYIGNNDEIINFLNETCEMGIAGGR